MNSRVAIVAAKRTPIGAFQGCLAGLRAPELAATAIKGCLDFVGLDGTQVEEVRMGNVLQAGIGQAPARQAAVYAGLPKSVPCITLNKVCGSGMAAMMDQSNAIRLGQHQITIAGGMESMTNAPYLLPGARSGYRMNNKEVTDCMVFDGLWDPYNDAHMGLCGETCAEYYGFTREAQDEFALESLSRTQRAVHYDHFVEQIVPIEAKVKGKATMITYDEPPTLLKQSKIPHLKPVFKKDGTITAANASSIADGAAAVCLTSEEKAAELGLKPLGYITGYATFAHDPLWFTTAPVYAVRKVLDQLSLKVADIDLWEINEAFAVTTMAAEKELGLKHDIVNVDGGSCALGHPIGCTGARIVVTLLHQLHRFERKRGLATACIGGGEATAIVVERAE
jgi:acetyl-CoA C-acetyltransferase